MLIQQISVVDWSDELFWALWCISSRVVQASI
jgi:hypothetical protein